MKLYRFGVAVALLLGLVRAAAQTPLPTDSTIRTGTLANGLSFQLVQNLRQRDRVFLELAVRAGSIDEADNQRGVAHLLEHMAFNGSTHFKPGEMFSYFQSIGDRIGPHVNAATGYDSTTYLLDVPADRDGAVGRAFEAMRDVAGGLTLDGGAGFERERNVVIEEWRGRLGVSERAQQPRRLALLGGSAYAERLPIGDPDGIARMPIERVRDFYRDEYRPDRMALVVVGALGTGAMETLLHASFDDLPARPAAPHALPVMPAYADTRYAAFSDPEAQSLTVGVTFTHASPPLRTAEDLRGDMVRTLATGMMGDRFAQLARQPDAPFLSVAPGRAALVLGTDAFSFTALIAPGRAAAALAAVLQELARARERGFTEDELARARLQLSTALQRGPADNRSIATMLVRHFLRDEPSPSPAQIFVAAQRFLPQITTDEVRQAARELWSDANRVITSTAPATGSSTPVTEAALRDVVRTAAAAPLLPPWQPAEAAVPATAAALPAAGRVEARREIADAGVTVLTLSNGVEVWLKPTAFNRGEVRFRADARGGAALAPPAEFQQAMESTAFVAGAGVGGLAPDQRARDLAGRQVQVRPIVGATSHGVIGAARMTDVDAAFNLAHLFFTAPNHDAAALARVKSLLDSQTANRDSNPTIAWQARVREVNTGGFYMLRVPSAADLGRIDPEAALRFYGERFANAANFAFFVVGSFTVEGITPLLEKYIGSLPSKQTPDAVPAAAVPAFPAAVVRDVVRKGRDPRSQTAITFFADTGLEPEQVERVNATAAVLQRRLFERLRESLGATYSVTVNYSDLSPLRGFGTVTVNFGSAPETADRLVAQALDEVAALRANGPTAEETAAVKAARTAELRQRLARNDYWTDELVRARALGRDPAAIAHEVDTADAALTVAGLKDAARRYLPENRYTVVTLLPEAP
jgi:zinc protease